MNAELNLVYDYQVGGCLSLDCPTYVKRQADFDFYQSMMAGEFCYVLNSRQMGKSSLRVQTMQRLRSQGIACASIDLTEIGSRNISPDQWYAGITYTLANSFNLLDKVDIAAWWCGSESGNDSSLRGFLSPVQRLGEFIRDVLLRQIPQTIAIFVDEIDSVLSLNFPVDDFFALIRSCYNKRADQPEYKRLTWALLGVATPSELIQDKNCTPFNIGQAIELTGFQLHESLSLSKGLSHKTSNPETVLRAILDWTGGKPFLTQRLCKLVLQAPYFIPTGGETEWVEELVRSRIIENWEAQDEPEHLRTIRDRLLGRDDSSASRRLALYQKILLAGEIPVDDSPEQMELRLSGLVVKHQAKLKVYNRIYELIFNPSWVLQELEKRRPYKAEQEAWIASGCIDDSRLLTGDKLQGALSWAKDKTLNAQDYQFLKASQNKVIRMTLHNDSSKGDNDRPTSSDEQLLYDHLLYLVQRELPSQLVQRFRQLFIDGIGYPDQEIEAALYRVIVFLEKEGDFIYFLNRCCYIVINRWQLQSKRQDAIAELVGLFKNPSSPFGSLSSRSPVVKRLRELIDLFTKSEEYLNLQRLVQVVQQVPDLEGNGANSYLGQLIHRYPYLYTHCLLPEESSFEHRQTIRYIQSQKQRQFEQNLSLYVPYLLKRVQIASQIKPTNKVRFQTFKDFISKPETKMDSLLEIPTGIKRPVPNPTLLSDDELYLAVKHFVGKVEKSYSYRDLAQIFLNRTRKTQSYREFKDDLYQYLIDSIDPKYGKHQFNDRLYKHLKSILPEKDSQPVDEFLIMRTCSQLFNFIVASPQHPDFYVFFDLISNLGATRTTALLLKIALLSGQVKPHLERRFSILFSYYESQAFPEMGWLIQSLENLNVALVTNFGGVDLSSIKNNII